MTQTVAVPAASTVRLLWLLLLLLTLEMHVTEFEFVASRLTARVCARMRLFEARLHCGRMGTCEHRSNIFVLRAIHHSPTALLGMGLRENTLTHTHTQTHTGLNEVIRIRACSTGIPEIIRTIYNVDNIGFVKNIKLKYYQIFCSILIL